MFRKQLTIGHDLAASSATAVATVSDLPAANSSLSTKASVRLAGGSIAAAAQLAPKALQRVLLPLLAAPDARRSEVAADTAQLLVSLRLWRPAAALAQSAAAAVCSGLSGGAASSIGSHSAAATAFNSADCMPTAAETNVGPVAGAAAASLEAQLQRLSFGTAATQAALGSTSPAHHSTWNQTLHRQQPLLLHAALPLLCQLAAAAAAAAATADGLPGAAASHMADNATPSNDSASIAQRSATSDAGGATALAATAAHVSLSTVRRLLAASAQQRLSRQQMTAAQVQLSKCCRFSTLL